MPKRTNQIKRVQLGPLSLVTAPKGAAARLFDNRFTARRARRGAVPSAGRVTRADLDAAAAQSREAADIVASIRGITWYHTLDLGHGVMTPGFVDHRGQLPLYDLPASLAGKRCLDVATYDGFWAFEFERRGATDVVAVDVARRSDIDCPRWMLREQEAFGLDAEFGRGFAAARDALASKVQRVERSVYDLDPEVDGYFDFVFISDVLIHLRDPQLALERAYGVCKGEVVLADVFSPELDALGEVPAAQFLGPGETWWYPNVACLRQMLVVAGFEPVEEVNRFVLDAVGANQIHKVVLRARAAVQPSWTVEARAAIAKQAARRDVIQS